MFDRNPIQKLEFKTKETPDLNIEYQLENIIYTDTDEYYDKISQAYPETLKKRNDRIDCCRMHMVKTYLF